MSDEEPTAGTDPRDTAGSAADEGEPAPEDLAGKIHELQRIVQGILFADAAASGVPGADPAPPIGRAGTVEPVEDTAEEDRGGPWNWVGIDTDRRHVLANELVTFVAWLEERYLRHLSAERFQLPANWYDSPVVVEVLTAVMVARQAAYTDLIDAPSSALSEWHERALWPAIDRLQSIGIFHDNTLITRARTPVAQHGDTEPLVRAAAASAAALTADQTARERAAEPVVEAVDDKTEPVTEPIPIIPS